MMLCNITKNQPVDEFMNLNAYKTAFSISDYVRSHLIMLNTLHYDKLKENISDISAGLSESTYKSAIAELYNRVLDILYNETDKNGEFSSPYKVLVNKKRCKDIIDADDTKESRINVLFENKNKKIIVLNLKVQTLMT